MNSCSFSAAKAARMRPLPNSWYICSTISAIRVAIWSLPPQETVWAAAFAAWKNGWTIPGITQNGRQEARPSRRILGSAAVVFISSHPQTAARGETADHLLVIDELQDQQLAHIEAVFTPMRAANNATAVYLGTVRTRHDALWLKKEELERQTAQDGVQRVFIAGPDLVTERK